MEQPKVKKNRDLAALLGDGSNNIEQKVTGKTPQITEKTDNIEERTFPAPKTEFNVIKASTNEDETETIPVRKEEPRNSLEQELSLPKTFTRAFQKNPGHEKAARTSTLINKDILEQYKKVASAMDVDTVVLINNVLTEWFNKNLEPIEKVVNRKAVLKPL